MTAGPLAHSTGIANRARPESTGEFLFRLFEGRGIPWKGQNYCRETPDNPLHT